MRVRDDEVEVEADGVAEALTGRARAERVVEAEQARLGLRVDRAVVLALEAFGETCSVRGSASAGLYERRAVTLDEAGLERIDQTLAHVGARGETVDQNVDALEVRARVVVGRAQLDASRRRRKVA